MKIQHKNVSYEANKLHSVHLLKMKPYKKYKVLKSIHALIAILLLNCKPKTKIPLNKYQGVRVYNTTQCEI